MGRTLTYVCTHAHVAVAAEGVATQMGHCENSRTGGLLGGICNCPTVLMSHYKLTLAELTYCMEQKQPTVWTDPGQFCGNASLNCAEPRCIPLPR